MNKISNIQQMINDLNQLDHVVADLDLSDRIWVGINLAEPGQDWNIDAEFTIDFKNDRLQDVDFSEGHQESDPLIVDNKQTLKYLINVLNLIKANLKQ